MLAVISYLLFVISPLISLPIILLGYLFDKKKKSFTYALLMGLLLGIISYHFIPLSSYDLYRHHLVCYTLKGKTFAYLLKNINNFDLELFPLLYTYIISMLKNINLQQFFVVTIGYTIIFSILYDYRKKENIKLIPFLIITCFTYFGFNALNFISGLWFYIALITLFLTLYLDYYCKWNKKIVYVLYIATLFMHTSMFFPIVILIIYKIMGNKFNLKSLMICGLIFMIPTFLLSLLNSIVSTSILSNIEWLINVYFDNNYLMQRFYSGNAFYIEMIKLFISLLFIFLLRKEKKFENIKGFIIILSVCTLIMMIKSIVMIRFIMLIQFLSIPFMIEYFSDFKKRKIWMLFLLAVLTLYFGIFFFKIMLQQNYGNLKKIYNKSFISLMSD